MQNPLKMHRRAMAAALASAAADRQGKFWEYHDKLFEDQRRLSDSDLAAHAQALGLDMARFNKDLQDAELKAWIEQQAQAVNQLGARGTPAFFINGKKSVGWGSKMGIVGQIKREINATKSLVAGGKKPAAAFAQRVQSNSDAPEFFLAAFGMP